MLAIQPITANSPLLDEVRALWKANRATLGFYPEGAFLERAAKGQILAAIKDGVVAGYALFYTTQKRGNVRLSHLCITAGCRGQGIARALIDELRRHTRSCVGIGLYCRRDFSAWHLWPQLGFVAVSEKQGRSVDGHDLTYFWMRHPHPTLFSTIGDEDSEQLKVAIDANVFYDLIDHSRRGAEETLGLLADWLQPSIRLCITDELFNEIHRHQDSDEKRSRLLAARRYDCLETTTDDFFTAYDQVKTLLGEPVSESDKSDQRHLARTMASDATVFVTRDEPLLNVAGEIYNRYGLSVVRPSQLVGQFEELRNERLYQRDRLAGTSVQIYRINTNARRLAEAFVDQASGERVRDVTEYFNLIFAHPDQYECHLVEGFDSKPFALYIAERQGDHLLAIPRFRIARNILNTRLAPTLARTLLTGVVQRSLKAGMRAIQISEPQPTRVLISALRASGFFQIGNCWFKLSLSGVHSITSAADRLAEVAKSVGVASESYWHIQESMCNSRHEVDAGDVLEVEHLLWPCKLKDCGIPNYVISIKPRWASDLFDAELARYNLWGADTELALNPDSVYYRAVKPNVLETQGRILWYVSSDDDIPGSKRIRACSQLVDVATGYPKPLYARYRRFGVYDWHHVLRTAGGLHGQVMVLQFSDTELFANPVDQNVIRALLHSYGVRSTFQSPTRIPEEAFLEIYELGMRTNSAK